MSQGRILFPRYTKARIETWLLDFDGTSQAQSIVRQTEVWGEDTEFQPPVATPLSPVMIELKDAQPEQSSQELLKLLLQHCVVRANILSMKKR